MRVCENEHVQCPYCGNPERLREVGLGSACVAVKVFGGDVVNVSQKVHGMTCECCGGEFYVPCGD